MSRRHDRGRLRMDSYRIDGVLGEGGMGIVYRAFDTKLNRPVAVKFLSEDAADAAARRRFQREAQTASSLNHPHILTVYDVGEVGRTPVHRHGVRRRRNAARLVGCRAQNLAAGYRAARRRCRWTGDGSRRRDSSSRYQAGERAGQPQRLREARRLRPRQSRRACSARRDRHDDGDARRSDCWHRRVHVTGAGRRAARSTRAATSSPSACCSTSSWPDDARSTASTVPDVLHAICHATPEPLAGDRAARAAIRSSRKRSKRIRPIAIRRCASWWWICGGWRDEVVGKWRWTPRLRNPLSLVERCGGR